MKKLVILLSVTMATVGAMAQQADTVYVVFTPTESEEQGVWEWIFDEEYDDPYDYYRYPVRDYTILNRSAGYDYSFEYVNRNTELPEHIRYEPESFLDTIEYIDWDEIGPTLTKAQADALIADILSHDKIYFIPLSPVTTNSQLSTQSITLDGDSATPFPGPRISLVPVVQPRPRY